MNVPMILEIKSVERVRIVVVERGREIVIVTRERKSSG